ncbi:MAG: hypothetical protein WC829_02005 [Hyphomicrobium sp.]
MPPLDDNMEMDPSDISDLDEQAKPVTAEPDDAASSPATGETDADLLSVAQSAIKEVVEPKVTAPPADDVDDGSSEPKKPDDVDYSDVPFNKHPRFQQLLRKSKEYEQDAVRYRNVEGFISDAGLEAEEAAEILTIGGLIKTNPVEAWARIKPTIQKLLVAAGEIVPDDLQGRVANGEMSREAAIEVSRARAAYSAVQGQQAFREQRQAATEHSNFARSLTTAASDWERDRTIKDPNYADKQQAIMKEVLYLQQTDGRPNTPEGVKAQLQKAYKAVNESFRAPAPPVTRPAVKPVTGGQVVGNQRPAPKNTLDIVKQFTSGR